MKNWKLFIAITLGVIAIFIIFFIYHKSRTPLSIKEFPKDPPFHVVSSTTPQFIIFSFDGSDSISMWEETLNFAQWMRSEHKPLSFTYFINPAYLLTPETKDIYISPDGSHGKTAIGSGDSNDDVSNRIKEINRALSEHHEIGSHTVGHWNGSKWSYKEWKSEFTAFKDIINAVKKNPAYTPALTLSMDDIRGFRAPDLGVDAHMYEVLHDEKFLYDTSEVSFEGRWPKYEQGIWHIPLASIPFGKNLKPVLTMDYSIWAHQTKNKNILKKDTPQWNQAKKDIFVAYTKYFENNVAHHHAPVIIAHHFSLWNDGLYWEALKTFAESVCGKPDVHCSTYSELVTYLNNQTQ